MAEVLVDFITKDNECRADKPGDAIRVTTGAPTFNQVAQFYNWRKATAEVRRIESETLEVCGQIGKTMNAGPALTGPLSLHVANHPS